MQLPGNIQATTIKKTEEGKKKVMATLNSQPGGKRKNHFFQDKVGSELNSRLGRGKSKWTSGQRRMWKRVQL